MSKLDEIESALQELSRDEKWQLADRLWDILDEEWDREIEEDAAAGRLNESVRQVERDISRGWTKPLDEIIGDA